MAAGQPYAMATTTYVRLSAWVLARLGACLSCVLCIVTTSDVRDCVEPQTATYVWSCWWRTPKSTVNGRDGQRYPDPQGAILCDHTRNPQIEPVGKWTYYMEKVARLHSQPTGASPHSRMSIHCIHLTQLMNKQKKKKTRHS